MAHTQHTTRRLRHRHHRRRHSLRRKESIRHQSITSIITRPPSAHVSVAEVAVAKLAAAGHDRKTSVHAVVNLARDDAQRREAAAHAADALGRRDDAEQNDLLLLHTAVQQHLQQ